MALFRTLAAPARPLAAALLAALLAAFVSVSLAVSPASAQDTQAADTAQKQEESFSEEHLRKAAEVIKLTRSAEGFDDILPRIAEQTTALFTRSNPALAQEIEDVTTEVALDMAKRRVELDQTLEKIWARRFTVEELDDLIAFFSSETGRKFAELTPSITALAIGASRQWQQAIATDMVTAVRAKLRERGHNL